ncbi:heterokaryon incompatibility protein [Zalerion maritima]|uniref:Heterokaryon incompatibility protein n=1 Tax=Zalerion maritima TaxID=339359 RepID=A0AAD5RQC4_9PEZI|nr:heterokaryon incompatibility protein [Zalerion maritima]
MTTFDGGDCGPPGDLLCTSCTSLSLRIEKFLPAYISSNNELPGVLASSFDPHGMEPRELGFLDEIYLRRTTCSFCWLLFKATHSRDGGGIGYDGQTKDRRRVQCRMDWHLDGRVFDDKPSPGRDGGEADRGSLASNGMRSPKSRQYSTRRIRLFNPDDLFPEAYIMLLLTAAAPSSIQSPTFLGRKIPRYRINLDILRSWLYICDCEHGSICDVHPALSLANRSSRITDEIRLIDLELECLRHPGSLEGQDIAYATVSYIWGTSLPLTLTGQTYDALSINIGPNTPDLPRTLRDAMVLVKELGIRYIWIDGLCIVQDDVDDVDDKAVMIKMMDRIYGNGVLNICAAAGSSARDGIPGSPHTLRDVVQPVARCASMELMVTTPVERRIEKTTWNTRAWTFQERMLSRRSIIVVEDCVFFQCRRATWSEEVDSETSSSAWTLEMIRSPLEGFEKNPVRLFVECVELFSARKLTYLGDKLAAFEGMAAVLCPPLKSKMHYGLPDAYFDFALLWDHRQPGSRIQPDSCRGLSGIFPSWSWCGFQNGVLWRTSMIEGVLFNLHEWLEQHTWIVWHKTSQDGSSLRPVWSSSDERGLVGSMESRWVGYSVDFWEGSRMIPNLIGSSSTVDLPGRKPIAPTNRVEGWQSYVLYFWTYTAFFQLSRQSMTGSAFASDLEPGLHRFGILDQNGDWCGTMVLDENWYNQVGRIFEFAAISEARDFSMEELDTWNYYIPGERKVSEWYLVYALLITWDKDRTVAERAGIAKIYQNAFRKSSFPPGSNWREIALG